MTYKPKPVDTRSMTLPSRLEQLKEVLAANIHDHWAQQRLVDGWRYGPKQDEAKKEHPLLVPYSELSEEDKDYDRITAIETLKTVLAHGFELTAPAEEGEANSSEILRLQLEIIEHAKSVHELQTVRRTLEESSPEPDARLHRVLAEQLLKHGEPLMAYDVALKGLRLLKQDLRLEQLQAVALARSGAFESANRLAHKLWDEGARDPETCGILARTHKDLWLNHHDLPDGQQHLEEAHRMYLLGYNNACASGDIGGAVYNGINAATTALMMCQKLRAEALACEVLQLCRNSGQTDYWTRATEAEAALVRHDFSAAEGLYASAAKSASGFADVGLTRKQARLILAFFGEDPRHFDHCFPMLSTVIVRSADALTKWPSEFEQIRKDVEAAISSEGCNFVYATVLAYPDLAVVEALLNHGDEVHVVLPYRTDRYESIAAEHRISSERAAAILGRCADVVIASEQRQSATYINTYFAEMIRDGLGLLHAQALDTDWSMVALSHQGGQAQLAPARMMHRRAGEHMEVFDRMPQKSDTAPERIRAILFADAVKFSRLTEDQIPIFAEHFLGAIAALEARSTHRPITKNTWGDALYFVFRSSVDAGQFALELRDLIRNTDWASKGLPKELSLRIALHAGPVFEVIDPITRKKSFMGVHVNHGARIEPITPAGHVYASQSFAAFAAAEGVTEFRCEYVGTTPLAKGYGTFATYHVTER